MDKTLKTVLTYAAVGGLAYVLYAALKPKPASPVIVQTKAQASEYAAMAPFVAGLGVEDEGGVELEDSDLF